MSFDYDAPADFFPARSRKGGSVRYRRFDTAAEALRFAIEELPPLMLVGACLQVEDERFDSDQYLGDLLHRLDENLANQRHEQRDDGERAQGQTDGPRGFASLAVLRASKDFAMRLQGEQQAHSSTFSKPTPDAAA